MTSKIYRKLIKIAEALARGKHGALFVLGSKKELKGLYNTLYPQGVLKLDIHSNGSEKVIEKLALLDGAVLFSEKGKMFAYGAKLKKSKTIQGFGTRHAAASGITTSTKSTAILVSEESSLIKVFREGRTILQMDSREKPQKLNDKIVAFLSEGDTALLAAAGASAAVAGPALLLGPVLAPIIIVGGSVYLAMRTAARIFRKK